MSFLDYIKNIHVIKDETIFITDKIRLVNPGFPSTFNLSYAEDFWTRILEKIPNGKVNNKFYNYTQLPLHSFSATAPVIRINDLEKILGGSQKHLLFFHIIDVNGCAVTKNNENYHEFFITNFFNFLEALGLDLCKVSVTIHPGNETIVKHGLTFKIPPDRSQRLYENLAKERGFEIKKTNENTFLALKMFGNPTPWGFRNEILYRWDNDVVDIGTIEYLYLQPKFILKNGKIIYTDITEWDKMFIVNAIGLERVLMIINGLKSIYDLPPFLEIEAAISQKSQFKNKLGARLMGQLLLTLSAIFCETGGFSTKHMGDRRSRKETLNTLLYYFVLTKEILKMDIDVDLIKTIFLAYNNYFPFGDLKLDTTTLSELTLALNKEYYAYQEFISKRKSYKNPNLIKKLEKCDKIREKIEANLYSQKKG
jgi:hypothetical protein